MLTQDPATFKGGGIWRVMLDINGVLKAIGYGLLGGLFITVLSFIIILTVYSRMFKL